MHLKAAELAYNSEKSEYLGMTPSELDIWWKTKLPFDVLSQGETPVESVTTFQRRLQETLNDARYVHQLAKERNMETAAGKYKVPVYEIGDLICVNRSLMGDKIPRIYKSDKLGARCYGTSRIMEIVSQKSVRVDFPTHIHVKPVVHVENTVQYQQ